MSEIGSDPLLVATGTFRDQIPVLALELGNPPAKAGNLGIATGDDLLGCALVSADARCEAHGKSEFSIRNVHVRLLCCRLDSIIVLVKSGHHRWHFIEAPDRRL